MSVRILTNEEQTAAQLRLDGREDLVVWRSECNALLLLEDDGEFFVCCGGFYDGWDGSAAKFYARYGGPVLSRDDQLMLDAEIRGPVQGS